MEMSEEEVNAIFMEIFGSMMGGRRSRKHQKAAADIFMFMDMMDMEEMDFDEEDDEYLYDDNDPEYFDDCNMSNEAFAFDNMAKHLFYPGEVNFDHLNDEILAEILSSTTSGAKQKKKNPKDKKINNPKQRKSASEEFEKSMRYFDGSKSSKSRAPLRQYMNSDSQSHTSNLPNPKPIPKEDKDTKSKRNKSNRSSDTANISSTIEQYSDVDSDKNIASADLPTDSCVDDDGWETASSDEYKRRNPKKSQTEYITAFMIEELLRDSFAVPTSNKKKKKSKKASVPLTTKESKSDQHMETSMASEPKNSSNKREEVPDDSPSKNRSISVGDRVLVQNRYQLLYKSLVVSLMIHS